MTIKEKIGLMMIVGPALCLIAYALIVAFETNWEVTIGVLGICLYFFMASYLLKSDGARR